MSSDEQMTGEAPTRLARKLPAGMVDTALASLATFAIGITAANLLDPRDLGVYAVFFTAFMFGTVLPRNLIFTPAEVATVARPLAERLKLLAQSVRLGLVLALIGASAVFIAAAITTPLTDPEVLTALMVTTGIAIVLSPIQDHIRKMFHIADHSWLAATVSAVQVVVAGFSIGGMILVGVPAPWIPFGTLVLANTVSLSVAWVLALRVGVSGGEPRLHLRDLLSFGKWLVVQASVPWTAGFIVAAVIVSLAGPEVLGYAEAARIVAQPVIVLASGLTAVLAPRAMEASLAVDIAGAKRLRRIYLALVAIAGIGYLAVAGTSWVLNPMEFLVPAAYVVPGLVAVTVVTNAFGAAQFLQVDEILAARREKSLTLISLLTSPIVVIVAFTSGSTGAFARPLGRLVTSWVRLAAQGRLLRRHYVQNSPEIPADSVT